MAKTVTLIVPSEDAADYPISFRDREYKPYRENVDDDQSRWLVKMPADIAAHFIHNGGFALMSEQPEDARPVVPAGAALVRHVGFDGKSPDPRAQPSANSQAGPTYVDDVGRTHPTWMVPMEAVDGLVASHGFKVVDSISEDGAGSMGGELRMRFVEMQQALDAKETQIEALQNENEALRDALGRAEAERDAAVAAAAPPADAEGAQGAALSGSAGATGATGKG